METIHTTNKGLDFLEFNSSAFFLETVIPGFSLVVFAGHENQFSHTV